MRVKYKNNVQFHRLIDRNTFFAWSYPAILGFILIVMVL
jgi:uncharacterized membrane protein YozB (DUF420 family)